MQYQYRANRANWRCLSNRRIKPFSLWRQGFRGASLCLVALFLGCQPSDRVAVIEGTSMAPHLFGAHLGMICRECSCEAAFREDRSLKHPICPNCGALNQPADLTHKPAPPVLVSSLNRSPRRWEVVAFAADTPDSAPPRLTVKRIVGLPNESLQISEGDLWADGQRLIKSWPQQQELAVLLRDCTCLPIDTEGKLISPWQSPDSPAHWASDSRGVRTIPGSEAIPPWTIEYQHWAGYHSGQPRFCPVPVLDSQPFDPQEARSLTTVHDLMLTGRCDSPDVDYQICFRVFEEPLTFEFAASHQCLTIRTGERLLAELPFVPPSTGYRFGISTFDRAATVAIDNRETLQIPLDLTPSTDREQLSRPITLTALGRHLEISQLKLFRDVYYLDHPGRANQAREPRTFSVSSGAYLLLGDNPIDSIDSRHWDKCGLPISRIIGKVVLPTATSPN